MLVSLLIGMLAPMCGQLLIEACLTCAGIDAGVFLVRNGPFIRALFDRLADTARSLPLPASYVSPHLIPSQLALGSQSVLCWA